MPKMDLEGDIADEIVRYFDENSIEYDQNRSAEAMSRGVVGFRVESRCWLPVRFRLV